MKVKKWFAVLALVFTGFLHQAGNNFGFSNTFLYTESKTGKSIPSEGKFSINAIGFIENKGQVYGYDGLPHPEVKFIFQQGAMQIFLLDKGIAYQFTRVHYPEGYLELMKGKGAVPNFEESAELQKQIRTETFRMDMTLLGANKNGVVTSEGKSTDYTNFYNHNVLDVHSYTEITYHDVYPGIDWIIYCKDNSVKYDFVVHPGADPSLIKMQFEHQEDLKLNEDGSFTLKSSLGSISENRPVSFQEGREIETEFSLNKNTLAFRVNNYNKNQTLVIDPALVWATYYGGAGNDFGYSSATDLSNNVYLAGGTVSTASISAGGHQNAFAGTSDAFLVKFNSIGVRLWATYYGGSNSDVGYACTTDLSGNVYLAGSTTSSAGIGFNGYQNNYFFGSDAFLAKFNSSGVRQWATYYNTTHSGLTIFDGPIGQENGYGCSTDPSGNVYLTGSTTSQNQGIYSGGHQQYLGSNQSVSAGVADAFLVKFNSGGVRQWGTYYGGLGSDIGRSCVCDASGNIYIGGETNSTSSIASGGHQNTLGGNNDAFLVKFNGSGVRQWATYYGSSGTAGLGIDVGYACATDISGNVFLSGVTTSTNNIASGAHQMNHAGGSTQDAFLVKFNSAGVRQWATYYGGTNDDVARSCATNTSGEVYLAGNTSSSINIASGGYQNTASGSDEAFLVKFNGLGVRQWGTYYGDAASDYGQGCAIDATGNLYLSGYTQSTVGIATGGHQNTFGGTNDAFLVKFCDGPSQPSAIVGNTAVCFGTTQNYSVTNDLSATSYSWNVSGTGWTGTSSNNTISVTAGTNGNISVMAINACAASPVATLSVVSNSLPMVAVNSGSICSGQSFTILPGGANAYTIQGGNSVVSPIANTSYTVIGSSIEGCISQNTATSNVTVHTTPTVSVNSGSICSGDTFTLVPLGANSYSIQGGNAIVSPLSSASYTLVGLSTEGCLSQNTATSNVTVHTTPTISVNSGSICSGEAFTIVPLGANTYSIQGGNAVVMPLSNTGYTVMGTSTAGCISSTVTSSVTVNPLPILSVNAGTICNGESFTISPSGASTYTFSGGTSIVSPATNTSYSVTGTSTAGCVSSAPAVIEVTVFALPLITANGGTICLGQNFTIVPSGANTYSITGNTFVVNPSANTSYTVTGTSAAGCVSTLVATPNITVYALPSIMVNQGEICAGESFTINPSGALTYTVTGGSWVVSPSSNSSYSVTGTNSFGCEGPGPAVSSVTVHALPTLSITSSSSIICLGESITLNVSGANTYTWSGGTQGSTLSVNPSSTTQYTASGSDNNNCTSSTSFTLNVDLCNGISQIKNEIQLCTVYPNPNNGEFFIEANQEIQIAIHNALGQLIWEGKASAGKSQINLSHHANGIYHMEIFQDGKTQHLKVIKQ